MLQLEYEPCSSPRVCAVFAGLAALLLLGEVVALGVLASGPVEAVSGSAALLLCGFGAPCFLVLVHAASSKLYSMAEPSITKGELDFEKLDARQRQAALGLAWAGPFALGEQPEMPSPSKGTFFSAPNVVGGGIWLTFFTVAAIANAGEPPNIPSVLVSCLLGWLVLTVTAVLHVLYGAAEVRAKFVAFAFAFERYSVTASQYCLRQSAVRWTWKHFDGWRRNAGDRAEGHALRRFGLSEGTAAFRLTTFNPNVHDMPPLRVPTFLLLVGDLLCMRNGTVLDVHQTSYSTSQGGAPAFDDREVREREVHYQDIVVIDYERNEQLGPGRGNFLVSLSDGTKIREQTLEENVDSSLEAIRGRTRVAKARLLAS